MAEPDDRTLLDRVLAGAAGALETLMRAYLATYRKTKSMVADAGRVDMPEEMKARLRELLLAQLRERR